MNRLAKMLGFACVLLLVCGMAQAQTFGPSGTTSLQVTVGAEAALSINPTSSLTNSGGSFGTDFTGTTNLTYKVRTVQSGGTGSITLKVTTDFGGTDGPKVANPPTAGDTLSYTCTVTSPGTGCSGSQTASTSADTPVSTFGADAKTAKAGNSGSVSWTLTNDPQYSTGSYTATVTFTISAA